MQNKLGFFRNLGISISIILLLFSCTNHPENAVPLASLWENAPFIQGKENYLTSPMFTPGNRLYTVGHQDGSFPELGWHVKDEMGGIWDHPIKLMDGFSIDISTREGKNLRLDKANRFINYPFYSQHDFEWPEADLQLKRYQFVPDDTEGMVVQLVINNEGETKELQIGFTGYVDLMPTWLGERTEMIDGQDEIMWEEQHQAWMAKDGLNPWFTIFGSDHPYLTYSDEVTSTYKGKGVARKINYLIKAGKGSTVVNFFIAGSYTSESAASTTFDKLKDNYRSLFEAKKERYQVLSDKTKLTIPDKKLEEAFLWLKWNSDWLVRSVPELGTGIGAGIPDYPWWFGVDSEYALQGYMMFGQKETVYKSIALIDSVSEALNGNGRIIHEMSTNGAVFNPGNINETPQFASLIYKIYQWTGDKAFLEKYFPTVEKGLDWLMKENDANLNGFPDGFGMMEIHGMDSEMIDVAAYTQKAFNDASQMATALGKNDLAKEYKEKALVLKHKINNEFWSSTFTSYADFIGSDSQALKLIDDAIVRADTLNKPWAVEELKATRDEILRHPSTTDRPFVMHHNWVVNTPMEVGLADKEKALEALSTAEQFVNPFGVFVTGIDRDASAGSDEGSFQGSKIFSYTGAVMTLPTGVLAIAENNYGRPDQALNYLDRMTRTFSYAFPGSMYEVSPDYGMMTQAWNAYSFGVPIVEQFFGIYPDAAMKTIRLSPMLPSSWDNAQLENVEIGDNVISIYYDSNEGKHHYKIVQSKTDWNLVIELNSVDMNSLQVKNGHATKTDSQNIIQITGNAEIIEINYENE